MTKVFQIASWKLTLYTLLFAAATLSPHSTSALSRYDWLADNPSDTKISGNSQSSGFESFSDCQKGSMSVRRPSSKLQPAETIRVCSIKYSDWELGWAYDEGGKFFLKTGQNDGIGYQLGVSQPLLINNPHGLFVQSHYPGSSSSVKQVGYYKNPGSFQLNSYRYYVPSSTSVYQPIIDPTRPGVALALSPGIGYSANGEWLILEAGTILRYNIESGDFLSFGYGATYNQGYSPGTKLGVSNDGRYALVTATPNLYTGDVYIYDLSTCTTTDTSNPLRRITDCQYRNLTQYFKDNFPGFRGMSNPEFSGDNSYINVRLHTNNLAPRDITIFAPNYEDGRLDYIALGDSFSSGEGDDSPGWYEIGTDGDGEAINNTGISGFPYWMEKCHISKRSYPYLLARSAAISTGQFKSVACSGSVIDDVTNVSVGYLGKFEQLRSLSPIQGISIKKASVHSFTPGREAQIKFVEKHKPRVATIGIGGNDINFAPKIAECIAALAETCRYASTDRSIVASEIDALYDKLVDTYRFLQRASPTTSFYAVSYPQLVTLGGKCSLNVRLDRLEQEFAFHTVNYLNKTIASAAAEADIRYLDTEGSLAGNNFCSSSNTMAVNGLDLGDDIGVTGGQSRFFGLIGAESYHPNEIGHQLMYSYIQQQLGPRGIVESNCTACEPQSTNRPGTPAYFATYEDPIPTTGLRLIASTAENIYNGAVQTIKQGQEAIINTAKSSFRANSVVNFILYSEPQQVGSTVASIDGSISTALSFPTNITPGFHTLYARGVDDAGQAIQYYQPIFIYATENDANGNGVLDQDEPCGFFDATGTDYDQDGIDDGCDESISEPKQASSPDTASESNTPLSPATNSQSASTTGEYSLLDTLALAPTNSVLSAQTVDPDEVKIVSLRDSDSHSNNSPSNGPTIITALTAVIATLALWVTALKKQ